MPQVKGCQGLKKFGNYWFLVGAGKVGDKTSETKNEHS